MARLHGRGKLAIPCVHFALHCLLACSSNPAALFVPLLPSSLQNFRVAQVSGWRRIFAHSTSTCALTAAGPPGCHPPHPLSWLAPARQLPSLLSWSPPSCAPQSLPAACAIFYERGISQGAECSSLSVEPAEDAELLISCFEIEGTREAAEAFVLREHEFRFVAVSPVALDGSPTGRPGVLCARWSDEQYRQQRCPPELWQEMYGRHGIDRIWREDVLPCRVYLRHCVLAAQRLGPQVEQVGQQIELACTPSPVLG